MGFGPATGPTLKTALCHIRALVGRFDKYRGPRGRSRAFVCGLSSPVLGLYSVGRLTSGRFCRVCLGTGDFLRPQGAIPPGFYPLRGGVIAWRLRRLKKGNADGAEGIFSLPDACGLRPCDRAHLKNGLVPYSGVGGTQRQIQRSTRTFSKSMYGTRPCCLVQAITRHTCPDPHLGL